MNKIFVSYSRRNKIYAERLARDLSDAGLDVWIDFRQIHAGEIWRQEIYRGLESSDMLTILLSKASIASEWVQLEVNTAREQGKFIIPIMIEKDILKQLEPIEDLSWLADVQGIDFFERYEEAFPELLKALPGKRRVDPFTPIDPANIPNPFKGLEAFQQTDASFFFGREGLVRKSINGLRDESQARFLAVVGASGSGKSSLVRAGVIPQLRSGALPNSESWRMLIFAPGPAPIETLAMRLSPLLSEELDQDAVETTLRTADDSLHHLAEEILLGTEDNVRLLLVIDQFEELFTRAPEVDRQIFLNLIHQAAIHRDGRAQILITMRADFFDRVGRYPDLAEMFEHENLVIVTEMTTANLLRTITGPAEAVGLDYEDGLADRILEDVRRQPGSLPLLQYALKELYARRDGASLTHAAYDAIGGVQQALATHAEGIFTSLNVVQQDVMKRVLLRLIEIDEEGEATRRRVKREDLHFKGVSSEAVDEVIDLMVAPESRLLIASRQIRSSDASNQPVTTLEVSHEALIREWERFSGWIADDIENLRYSGELLKTALAWQQAGRDPAYLLTGNRLVRGETWLEEADANPVQREFVRASMEQHRRIQNEQRKQAERELELQKRSTNRLRYFVGVLVLALIGSVALLLVAESFRREAEAQSAAAARNAAEARSLALAANAGRSLSDQNGDLALSLVIEANMLTNPSPSQSRLTLAEVGFTPGARQVFVGAEAPLNAVAYDGERSRAVTVDDAGFLLVWDTASGEITQSLKDPESDRRALAVALNRNGTLALTGSDTGALTFWDVETETITARQTGGDSRINALAFSPDGATALSAANDGTTILWDAATAQELLRLQGYQSELLDIAFNPIDSTQAISGSRDGVMILWDLRSGTPTLTLNTEMNIQSIAFSSDGNAIALGGTDGIVQIWHLDIAINQAQGGGLTASPETNPVRVYTGHESDALVRTVAFSHDGLKIASGASDESVLVWDKATGTRIATLTGHEGEIRDIAFGNLGDSLLSASRDSTLRLWDVRDAAIIASMSGHTAGALGRFLPGGQRFVSASSDNTLRLWDIASGRTIREYRGHDGFVTDVAVRADGLQFASVSIDGTIRLWDIATTDTIRVMEGHTDWINAIRYIPGRNAVVSAGLDGQVIVWDTETGAIIDQYTPADGQTQQFAVSVSPDGTLVASGGNGQLLTLWNIETGERVTNFEGHEGNIRAVDFSPDGQTILSGDTEGNMIQWDLQGDEIARYIGHNRNIKSVDFSPDGSSVMSAANDDTLRVWDTASASEIRIYGLTDERRVNFNSAVYSPDGQTVLSGLSDGRLRWWRLYPVVESMLSWTLANRFVPDLNCLQRIQFQIEPCDDDGNPPERDFPFDEIVPPLPETLLVVTPNTEAVVNTTGENEPLNLRAAPGLDAQILTALPSNTGVTILAGPETADDFVWWNIRTDEGAEGWSAEFEEGLQLLVPLSALP